MDSKGWTLLHDAASESQHKRRMLEVIRGLLQVMPIDLVNQTTNGGTPLGWAALSLVSNARDPHSERTEIVRMLVEKRANLEVRNAFGATPLFTACQVGCLDVVRVLLDAGANPHAINNSGLNALDVTPVDHTMAIRATKGLHRC